jgi:hypothetical protein
MSDGRYVRKQAAQSADGSGPEASLRSQYRFMELAREKAQAGPPLPGTGGTYHVRPTPPVRPGTGTPPGATAAAPVTPS